VPDDSSAAPEVCSLDSSPRPGLRGFVVRPVGSALDWLGRIDPGTHRRIKGLRLVTAYGIAAMVGSLQPITHGQSADASLSSLAGGFALWASVSEGQSTRAASSRDLLLLCAAAAAGAASMIALAPILSGPGRPGPELTLATGAFFVGYLKRFGILGAGIGSQIYIGQLLAYGAHLVAADLRVVAVAGLIAAMAAIVPRVLSGPAEKPVPALEPPQVIAPRALSPALAMGLQAGAAAMVIVALKNMVGMEESAWAVTASTYVIAGSAIGTIDRVRRRIIGTLIGVPLGIACLPLAMHAPLLLWAAAALAMVIYAMALPERYDIACAAFAFTLMVTLALSGVHSTRLLSARIWETLIGATLGVVAAKLIFPLRTARPGDAAYR
jgi:Fusaric acid resistance protein-like